MTSATPARAASPSTSDGSVTLAELAGAVQIIQAFVRGARPGSISGDEARALVAVLAQAERAASSGMALLTPVVIETGSFAKAGHGSAADWLGALAGSSAGAARGRLIAAERAKADPDLSDALHHGDLSSAQIKVVADTAAAAPGAASTLLGLATKGSSFQELADTASGLRAAARCAQTERARRQRVHGCRHLRWHQSPDGGIRGEFSCDEVQWARVAPFLEAEAKERWKAAGNSEALEAHRLDALVALLARSGSGSRNGEGEGSPSGATPHTVVIVNAEALRRGTARGDELCEIDGIGPVSVAAVTELIGEGALQFLVKDGVDIRTVTSTRRAIPQRVQAALLVRDRTCGVEECGKRRGLQGDHRQVDFGDDGPTCLDNLVRLCPAHHDLKTYGGWRLEGSPGHWDWVAPAHPKSALYIARARQLAAAKAKAKRARNQPLQI